MEQNVITVQLCEFYSIFLLVNFQHSYHHFCFLNQIILTSGFNCKLDFVLLSIDIGFNVQFVSQILNKSFLDQIGIATGKELCILSKHFLILP